MKGFSGSEAAAAKGGGGGGCLAGGEGLQRRKGGRRLPSAAVRRIQIRGLGPVRGLFAGIGTLQPNRSAPGLGLAQQHQQKHTEALSRRMWPTFPNSGGQACFRQHRAVPPRQMLHFSSLGRSQTIALIPLDPASGAWGQAASVALLGDLH